MYNSLTKKIKVKRRYKKDEVFTSFACLTPSFALFLLFTLIPLVISFYFSLFEINFYRGNTFVGFANYEKILKGVSSKEFFSSILIGLKYIAIIVPIQSVLAFLIANLIMSVDKKTSALLKVVIYLPCLLSGIVVGAIFSYIFNYDGGLINAFLEGIGLNKVNWTGDPKFAIWAVCLASIWNGIGYTSLVMLGGLYDIPKEYYEAAEIDGANWIQRVFHISLPSLKNVGLYLIISLIVSSFQLYEIAYVIVGSGALHSTEGPIYYLYYQFNYTRNMGEVYAASLIIAIVLTLISSVSFLLLKQDKVRE